MSLPGRRESWAGEARRGWGWIGEAGHLNPSVSPSKVTAFCPHQEHPFFTLHKTKKTDIAAFVKEVLGEDL